MVLMARAADWDRTCRPMSTDGSKAYGTKDQDEGRGCRSFARSWTLFS